LAAFLPTGNRADSAFQYGSETVGNLVELWHDYSNLTAGGIMKVRPKRKPITWPEGARIAITPCVAFETWPEDLGGPNTRQQQNRRGFPKNALTKKDLGAITDREFGERVGIYRFLEIFEKEQIKTTFFPTGITVENSPEIFQEAAQYGHEIGT
jgi:hypothetical protein